MKYIFYTTLILFSAIIRADDWQSCRQVKNDNERLACYDSIVAKLSTIQTVTHEKVVTEAKTQTTLVPQRTVADTETHVAPVDSETSTNIDLFGREADVVKQQVKQLDQISAKVVSVSLSLRKQFTVVLDNNQKWKQTDTRSLRIKPQDNVIIERGSLGSFFLKKKDSGTRRRVKRVN